MHTWLRLKWKRDGFWVLCCRNHTCLYIYIYTHTHIDMHINKRARATYSASVGVGLAWRWKRLVLSILFLREYDDISYTHVCVRVRSMVACRKTKQHVHEYFWFRFWRVVFHVHVAYACAHSYMHVCTPYSCACIHRKHTHINAYHTYIHVNIMSCQLSVHTYINTHTHTVNIVHICIYIYIHTHIYTYTHAYERMHVPGLCLVAFYGAVPSVLPTLSTYIHKYTRIL